MTGAAPTHSLPSLLLGFSLGWKDGGPTGQALLSPLALPSLLWRQQPGAPRLDWTEQRPCRQTSPELGWRAVREEEMGRDKGPLFGPAERLCGAVPPSPKVLLPWQNQKALSLMQLVGCNWYMFLESCLAASRESKMSLPSTSRNLF